MPDLHIDLFNFADEEFADSKYVLTSPRSLEACSRLEIKPVELLHKPLVEFEEELIPKGISTKTVFTLFDEHEIERLAKLARCRQERERIIVEEDGQDYIPPIITTEPVKSKRHEKTVAVRDTDPDTDEAGRGDGLDTGSLQRKRTAWATSMGHQRVTPRELDNRARELHEEGRKNRENILKGRPKGPGRPRRKQVTFKTKKMPRRKQSRDVAEKSYSISDVSSQTSNTSSRVAWLRDPRAEAKPITNPKLRSRLLNSKSPKITTKCADNLSRHKSLPCVSQRDQKILERMLAAREQDEMIREQQAQVSSHWDHEQQVAEYKKANSIRQRTRTISQERQRQEKHRLEVEARKRREDQEAEEEKERLVQQQEQQMQQLKERQLRLKEQKIIQQQLKSRERKLSQEERRQQQERSEEEFRQLVEERQKALLARAQSIKEAREKEVIKQKKIKSYLQKKAHQERLNKVKRQSMESLENIRYAMELRHSVAQNNHDIYRQKKEQELRNSQKELDRRIERSRILQHSMSDEMEAWHEEINNYRKLTEERALEMAKQKVEEKRKKAAEERRLRERAQREHMQELLQQEEEYKRDLEAHLALKEARSQAIQHEKEEAIQECRAMARDSERLRNELRQQYNTTKISDMDKQAQLQARIGGASGHHRSSSKNQSTLTLG